MSGFVPVRPQPSPEGAPPTTLVDRRLEVEWAERRWSARAAQWRAMALAAAVFGEGVSARLPGDLLDGPFRALLHLDVPFDGIERHRELEARFTAAAGVDPVLARVPMVYVFSAAVPR